MSFKALRKRQQSSQDSTPFFIADSSPLIRYGNSSTSTWTPGYALQSDGYDQTLHLTSSPESISFNISASSMTFLIPTYANCQATVTVNSSLPIPACATISASGDVPFSLYNLPLGFHNVQWNSGPIGTNDQVIFWGIDGERKADLSGATNVTIDNTYAGSTGVSFKYDGAWDHLNEESQVNLDGNFNTSLSTTTKLGASVTFTGTGSGIYLYGTVGPNHGSASVTLNGKLMASRMNLTSPWAMPYQLLWFASGIDDTKPLEMRMVNLEEKTMTIDFIVLTTDPKTLATLNTSGGKDSFVSTTTGKLVLYLLIPLVVFALLGMLVYCCIKRRRPRPSSFITDVNLGGMENYEKRDSTAAWSTYSGHTTQEVFVSYIDKNGRNQRLSDRWDPKSNSPVSPGSTRLGYRSPSVPSQYTLPALPEGQSVRGSVSGSPTREEGTGGSWNRPLRSLLGSSFTASSTVSRDPRRRTDLPPYSPGQNGTILTLLPHTSREFLSAEKEKERMMIRNAAFSDSNTSSRENVILAGPSRDRIVDRESTIAPSEVLSVFGQPGSERRDSSMTAFSHIVQSGHPSLPSQTPRSMTSTATTPLPPVRPTVITDLQFVSPPSALSSFAATSAAPLLRLSPESNWEGGRGGVRRTRSTAGMSVVSSEAGSAARPDSDIIPFESFMGVLKYGEGNHRSDRA